jgi:hypothetical protein
MAAAAWRLYAKAKEYIGDGTIHAGDSVVLRWPFFVVQATLRP